MYKRYVDDTFAMQIEEQSSTNFLSELNSLHPALQFTCEREKDNKLPFLDVLVNRKHSDSEPNITFETTIYRKPTFTGQYTRWDSFTARKYKTNLIKCLVNRAMKICSPNLLEMEIENLRQIFTGNGYPQNIINKVMDAALNATAKPYGPKRCPVYLRLPWKGRGPAERTEIAVTSTVRATYPTCDVRVVYGTRHAFPDSIKDILPTHSKSNVIYLFKCWCGSQYVGKTTQRLEMRIKQHQPTAKSLASKQTTKSSSSSSIADHLTQNMDCLNKFDKTMFSVVCKARTEAVLHVLEALYIRSLKPTLCKQMEFVKCMHLFPNGSSSTLA